MGSLVLKGGLLVVDAEDKDKIFPVVGDVMFDLFGGAKATTCAVAGDVELSTYVAHEIMKVKGKSDRWFLPNKTLDKVAKQVLSKLMGRENVSMVFYGDHGLYVIDGGYGYFPGDTELMCGVVLGDGEEYAEETLFNNDGAHIILKNMLKTSGKESDFYQVHCVQI